MAIPGLDRWITGNYGNDQFLDDDECEDCGELAEDCICDDDDDEEEEENDE